MSDGKLLLTIVIVLALIALLSPMVISALKESGHISMPRRKSSAFRQFPTFPDADGEE
jgi:hypothetical protein